MDRCSLSWASCWLIWRHFVGRVYYSKSSVYLGYRLAFVFEVCGICRWCILGFACGSVCLAWYSMRFVFVFRRLVVPHRSFHAGWFMLFSFCSIDFCGRHAVDFRFHCLVLFLCFVLVDTRAKLAFLFHVAFCWWCCICAGMIDLCGRRVIVFFRDLLFLFLGCAIVALLFCVLSWISGVFCLITVSFIYSAPLCSSFIWLCISRSVSILSDLHYALFFCWFPCYVDSAVCRLR